MATPICALAAATRRSAAATSGRRCSSSDGTPTGMLGGGEASGVAGSENADGGWPISSAMACSSWLRCTPTSIAWACALLSWASACTTSTCEATPPVKRVRVSASERSKAATVASSRRFWASSVRSWK